MRLDLYGKVFAVTKRGTFAMGGSRHRSVTAGLRFITAVAVSATMVASPLSPAVAYAAGAGVSASDATAPADGLTLEEAREELKKAQDELKTA